MIIEGGRSLKESVIRMMKIIYKTEEIPNETFWKYNRS